MAKKSKNSVMTEGKVQAGFPSPADDYLQTPLDLNEHLVSNPPATFFVRAQGDSMEGVGIYEDDLLIVDRSVEAKSGAIVIAVLDGEFTVKRFLKKAGKVFLVPENKKYQPIEISNEQDFAIWGVVVHGIHTF